jgi:hypothetical protein
MHARPPVSTIVAMNALGPVLTLLAVSVGDNPAPSYTDPAMHFSLEIPDGWVRVSSEELEANTKRMGLVPAPLAGFRPSGRLPGTYPFVAITGFRGKLTPLAELLEAVRKAHSSAIAKQKALDPRFEYTASEPEIDSKRCAVRCMTENHKPDGAVLHVREVAFPGRTGVVKLTFWHWKDANQTAWESMLDSVRFDSGFEYDEAAAARTPHSNSMPATFAFHLGEKPRPAQDEPAGTAASEVGWLDYALMALVFVALVAIFVSVDWKTKPQSSGKVESTD